MATVADQLRRAREAQQLNIYQVAEITKIKTDHIRALESGNYDTFSAPVYIRGFVRTYAKILKLDESQVVADLEAELGQTEKFRDPPPLTEQKKGVVDFLTLQASKLNWKVASVVLGIAGVVLVIYFIGSLIRRHHSADPLKDLGPGTYQAAPTGGETVPLPPHH